MPTDTDDTVTARNSTQTAATMDGAGHSQCTRMEVRCWRDPIVERVGFDACGDYVELFWLPIIGPTSTLLLRRLAIMAVLDPHDCRIDSRSMARALGLGTDVSSRSSFARSIDRLAMFGLVRIAGRSLEVRSVVPPLTLKQLSRLPEHLQIAHSVWSESNPQDAHAAAYGTMPTTGVDSGDSVRHGIEGRYRRAEQVSASAS